MPSNYGLSTYSWLNWDTPYTINKDKGEVYAQQACL